MPEQTSNHEQLTSVKDAYMVLSGEVPVQYKDKFNLEIENLVQKTEERLERVRQIAPDQKIDVVKEVKKDLEMWQREILNKEEYADYVDYFKTNRIKNFTTEKGKQIEYSEQPYEFIYSLRGRVRGAEHSKLDTIANFRLCKELGIKKGLKIKTEEGIYEVKGVSYDCAVSVYDPIQDKIVSKSPLYVKEIIGRGQIVE